ncbi:MAG: hypothetical protein DRP89_08930, partial [Candidatus Neomarinimicrobiota bacterium]
KYSRQSIKFLNKQSEIITKEKAKEIILLSLRKFFLKNNMNIDLKKLRGKWKNYFRVRAGKVRIVFSIKKNKIVSVLVHCIDFRSNVYKLV